jgi:putative aldouronate transport system permease protein
MKKLDEDKRFRTGCAIIMTILAIIALAPFILMISASITEESALINDGYRFFPKHLSLAAYRFLWAKRETIGRAYLVSIVITAVGTVINVVITSMFAYPLSRPDFKARNFMAFFVFFTMLFNGGMTASYIIWTQLFRIKNTWFALLLPNYLMSGMNVLLVRNYYIGSIPADILDAARIDGASELRIYRSIMLPLSKPVIITVAVFAGMAYWNDWSNAMYYITDQKMYGINAYLNNLQNNIKLLTMQSSLTEGQNLQGLTLPTVGARMAIAMIAVLPVMIIFPFVQSQIIKGVVIGGVKG